MKSITPLSRARTVGVSWVRGAGARSFTSGNRTCVASVCIAVNIVSVGVVVHTAEIDTGWLIILVSYRSPQLVAHSQCSTEDRRCISFMVCRPLANVLALGVVVSVSLCVRACARVRQVHKRQKGSFTHRRDRTCYVDGVSVSQVSNIPFALWRSTNASLGGRIRSMRM